MCKLVLIGLLSGIAAGVPSADATPVLRGFSREARSKGPLPIRRGGTWGYIDQSGNMIIAPRFELAEFFYEGLAAVRVNGKWGFIDTTGRVVIQPQYTTVTGFSDGLAGVFIDAAAPKDRVYGYLDTTGKLVIKCPGACGHPYLEGMMADAVEVFRCMDKSGVTLQQQYPCESATRDGAHAVLVDRWGYYDKSGNLAFSTLFRSGLSRFSEGLAAVQQEGEDKMGYINASGSVVIPAQFDRAEAFSEGLAPIQLSEKRGFIDHEGRLVIPAQFEAVGSFSDGYATAVIGGKTGYLDHDGRMVIAPRYANAAPFSEGLAAVCCENGKTGYIDKTGSFVIPPKYPPGARVCGPFSEGIALVVTDDGPIYIDRSGRTIASVMDDVQPN